MTKVVFTKGLPGSGKSTWAKEFIKKYKNWKRVSRDDFRLMTSDQAFNPKNEGLVTKLVNAAIIEIIRSGYNIIIDATHLNEKYINQIKNFIKENYGTDIIYEVQSFLHISIEECIKNDLKRPNSVGSDVIYGMYERYMNDRIDLRKAHDADMLPLYIFDIDGTLAKMHNRKPFEWEKVGNDKCREDVVAILNHLKEAGNTIYLFSGRDSCCKKETETWLEFHGVEYDELFMRAEGDNRKDSLVKYEIFMDNVYKENFNVRGIFDDRPQVIRMWKGLGLTVFNVDDRLWLTEF